MSMEKKRRVIVYVDGFNFYYGLKDNSWRCFYWLDMVKFFERFMRDDQELIKVKYFSAKPNDIDKSRRQNAFFQANKVNPKFELVLGKYLNKTITCHNCGYIINTYEEKETDVRIATQVVADAYYSSNLASLCHNKPILLSRYESRFRQSLLPDNVTLSSSGYVLSIPPEWKVWQVNRR